MGSRSAPTSTAADRRGVRSTAALALCFATSKSHRSRRIAPPRAASINHLYSGRKWTWTRLRVQAASDMITFPFTASVIG